MSMLMGQRIPARNFVQMLAVNVHNKKLSDEAFRELVLNTIQHVEGGQTFKKEDGSHIDGVRTYVLKEDTPKTSKDLPRKAE